MNESFEYALKKLDNIINSGVIKNGLVKELKTIECLIKVGDEETSELAQENEQLKQKIETLTNILKLTQKR